jgi:hypothetical protein
MLLTMQKTWEMTSPSAGRQCSVEPSEMRHINTVLPSFVDNAGTFAALESFKRQAAEKTARRKLEGRKPFEGLHGCLDYDRVGDTVDFVTEWRGEWTNPWENSF